MLNQKSKKLLSNIGVFAIGNLGSKLISFILVPIFTRYMSTSEFGHVDVITTTVNMLLPIIALSIAEAVFRFAMDRSSEEKEVISSSIVFTLTMILVSASVYPVLKWMHISYAGYILIYLDLGLLQALLQNFIRGIGFIRTFAANGLVTSVILACMGVWRIVVSHEGVQGYLEALIVSTLASILFLSMVSKIWKFISIRSVNKTLLVRMLRYSIPLIPNSFLWFFTNDANRYFIVGFIGLTANGLYAVATKLPTIINVFYTIFAQAWQISAVEEYESNKHSTFFSNVFNANISLSVVLIGSILIILRPLMTVFAASNYFVAWKVVPSLLFAAFFSNLSSFLGTIYLATKKTAGIMKTTIYGMIVNVFLNVILIPLFGLQGAGVGAAIGFAFIAFIRLMDVRKFVVVNVAWSRLAVSTLILICMTVIQFFLGIKNGLTYIILVLFEGTIVYINFSIIARAKRNKG